MIAKSHGIHVAKIVRRYKNRAYTSYLLRRSYREDGKVKHETLGNLSHLPEPTIDLVRRSLQGEQFVSASEALRITQSRAHGHIEAVLGCVRQLGLDRLIASQSSRQRDLILAMLVQQVIWPCSELATTRHWHSTSLADELHVGDASVNELYAALDWLLARQEQLERKLARRHLAEGSTVLYDVTSSYYEGRTCPLAKRGHNRDGKRGLPIIVYGVLADVAGRPVAVEVYPGNTGDPTTVPDQVQKLRLRFGLARVVLVGDRGMLTETQLEKLREYPGLGWISALRSVSIRELIRVGSLQRSLFDDANLAEISSPEFPGERLVACYNPLLADERRRTRQELLAATEKHLLCLARRVARRTRHPLGQKEIALAAGKFLNQYKVAKHFRLSIGDGRFQWERNADSIRQEEQLDGIYVIRTSEPSREWPAPEVVRGYKGLSAVERVFRGLKGIDLLVRPIRHREARRVRAHIFLCMLAHYVQWHLREAWKPLLFNDEDLVLDRQTRDPVAPAEPSESVKRKKKTQQTSSGLPVHSFRTLLAHLGARCRNTCQIQVTCDPAGATFQQVTEADATQREALRLLGL